MDPNHLIQVLANLLTNALKHGPRDSPVTLHCQAESLAPGKGVGMEGLAQSGKRLLLTVTGTVDVVSRTPNLLG